MVGRGRGVGGGGARVSDFFTKDPNLKKQCISFEVGEGVEVAGEAGGGAG